MIGRCFAILSLCLSAGMAAADQSVTISHFSGKPVPRFETLKYAAVNGRSGPSRDHPILWRYERQGLPVLIIKESRDWRRVRDPEGDEVWIRSNQLTDAPGAVVSTDTDLAAKPDQDARVIARLKPGVLVTLGTCEASHCLVEAGRKRGWVTRTHLWGAGEPDTAL